VLVSEPYPDRLAGRIAFEGQLEVELQAVDLRQPLALEAGLIGEVEEGQREGGERLDPAPLVVRQQDQGGGEVAQRQPADLGAERFGAVRVVVFERLAQLVEESGVARLGEGVGAPLLAGRVLVADPLDRLRPGARAPYFRRQSSSRWGVSPVISAASEVSATLISLRTPKSPAK
jgi:hypothetical protein